jgi:hypothetical protein
MEPVIDDYITLGYAVMRGAEYALVKKTSLFRTVDEVLLQLGERTDIPQKHDETLRRCRCRAAHRNDVKNAAHLSRTKDATAKRAAFFC